MAAGKPREVVEDQIMETGIDEKAEVVAAQDLAYKLTRNLIQKQTDNILAPVSLKLEEKIDGFA